MKTAKNITKNSAVAIAVMALILPAQAATIVPATTTNLTRSQLNSVMSPESSSKDNTARIGSQQSGSAPMIEVPCMGGFDGVITMKYDPATRKYKQLMNSCTESFSQTLYTIQKPEAIDTYVPNTSFYNDGKLETMTSMGWWWQTTGNASGMKNITSTIRLVTYNVKKTSSNVNPETVTKYTETRTNNYQDLTSCTDNTGYVAGNTAGLEAMRNNLFACAWDKYLTAMPSSMHKKPAAPTSLVPYVALYGDGITPLYTPDTGGCSGSGTCGSSDHGGGEGRDGGGWGG